MIIRHKIGTAESGFHDHAGRPGLVGGSELRWGGRGHGGTPNPESAAYQRMRNANRKRESDEYLYNMIRNSGTLIVDVDRDIKATEKFWKETTGQTHIMLGEFVKSAYNMEYKAEDGTIYSFEVTKITPHMTETGVATGIEIDGNIWVGDAEDKHKNAAGYFIRRLRAGGELYNAHLELDEQYQKNGAGTAFYRQGEKWAQKAKIDHIKVIANISRGGYAWARMGFDFQNEYQRHDFADKVFNKAFEAGGTIPYTRDRMMSMSAWELASMTTSSGVDVGKQVFMGSGWDGIKYLNKNSNTWKAGQMYYDTKDKSRKHKT